MYYLIQKNIFQDPRYDEIFHVMKALNLPFQEVRFQPNSTELNIETTRKDIFVYGSVKLAKTDILTPTTNVVVKIIIFWRI